jgi:hypothetical protein
MERDFRSPRRRTMRSIAVLIACSTCLLVALAPALKVQSFAAPALASREFREQIGAEIKASVDGATSQVADSAEGVAAAVVLVDASKSFSKSLPDVAKAASVAIATLRKKPDLRTVLQQAELLQQADAAARQSAAKGADKYRRVVEQHAGSAAAAVAESRLAKLRAE